jgi:hypothetical protein
MSGKKISEMTAITGAQLDQTNDVVPILDVSDASNPNKKISIQELASIISAGLNTTNTSLSIDTNTNLLTLTDSNLNSVTVDLSHLDSNGLDKNYVHDQIAPLLTWQISHNLDKFVSVSVVDSAGSVVAGEIKYVDSNNITLSFSAPFSGKAYCN